MAMSMQNKLWGEMETPRKNESLEKLLPDDVVNSLIKNAYKSELTKDDALTGYGMQKLMPQSSAMDCEMQHIIHLQRFYSKLRYLISMAKARIAAGTSQQQERLPNLPPWPKTQRREMKHIRLYPIGFLAPKHTPFTLGESSGPEVLSTEVCRQVLKKCVCALAAQAGWETSSEEALGVLRDAADDFLRRLTGLLRVTVDRNALHGESGFPDSMEQAFHTMGLGSIRSLHTYYQSQVIAHRQRLELICKKLTKEYTILAESYNKDLPAVHLETVTIKQEASEREESDEMDQEIPELHFPSSVDGDLNLQPSASLHSGFAMLRSLERQQLLSEDDPGGNVDLDELPGEEEVDVGGFTSSSSNHIAKRARR